MSSSKVSLRVPCSYQGGKQRIAKQIVDRLLLATDGHASCAHFYDLCCGSGAITLELINRGIRPHQITMLDKSSWGTFWMRIGSGRFDLEKFRSMLSDIPEDKRLVKSYMAELAKQPVDDNEAYLYPILQSCSFGGKQIWLKDGKWQNAFFRDYWEPTANSVRKSPANPMQPSPATLLTRITNIAEQCEGLTCLRADAMALANRPFPTMSIVYIDPPYEESTSYGFELDIRIFIEEFLKNNVGPLVVSEAVPLTAHAVQLSLAGSNGGISGYRRHRNQEWLSVFGKSSL